MSLAAYRASSTLALTLTSLATSSGLTVGRCSASYSNATNKDDFIVPTLKTKTGGTAPTAGGMLELWCFAQRDDSTWPEIFTAAYTGSNAGFTVLSREILAAGAKQVGAVSNDATASRDYVLQGRELSSLFGFVPKNFAFFFVQSSAQNLSSTAGDHVLTLQAANY